MKQTKKVGEVWVDAGCVWIGDPCYIIGTDKPELKTWHDFCDTLDLNEATQEPLGEGIGFVVESGYGDGSYPVSVTIEDGRVQSLTVTFF